MATSSGLVMQLDARCEIERLARAHDLDVAPLLGTLAPFLDTYLELALDDAGFEVITGGVGNACGLASASRVLGLGAPARSAFLAAAAAYPDAMLGLKVDAAGRSAPTLYHRPMMPIAEGLRLLGAIEPNVVRALGARLAPARTLYGLGFTTTSAGALRVKTYVLDDVAGRIGFRSVRATAHGVEAEARSYEAEAPIESSLSVARRAAIVLGVTTLGHVARSAGRGAKVYVERIGAIATDPAAR